MTTPFQKRSLARSRGATPIPADLDRFRIHACVAGIYFPWYNDEHKRSGIGYYTAQSVHYGRAMEFYELRRQTLLKAYEAHSERFVNKIPKPHDVPQKVWINPPAQIGGTEDMDQIAKIDSSTNMAVIFKRDLPKGGEIKRTGVNSSLIDFKRLSHFG